MDVAEPAETKNQYNDIDTPHDLDGLSLNDINISDKQYDIMKVASYSERRLLDSQKSNKGKHSNNMFNSIEKEDVNSNT